MTRLLKTAITGISAASMIFIGVGVAQATQETDKFPPTKTDISTLVIIGYESPSTSTIVGK